MWYFLLFADRKYTEVNYKVSNFLFSTFYQVKFLSICSSYFHQRYEGKYFPQFDFLMSV